MVAPSSIHSLLHRGRALAGVWRVRRAALPSRTKSVGRMAARPRGWRRSPRRRRRCAPRSIADGFAKSPARLAKGWHEAGTPWGDGRRIAGPRSPRIAALPNLAKATEPFFFPRGGGAHMNRNVGRRPSNPLFHQPQAQADPSKEISEPTVFRAPRWSEMRARSSSYEADLEPASGDDTRDDNAG